MLFTDFKIQKLLLFHKNIDDILGPFLIVVHLPISGHVSKNKLINVQQFYIFCSLQYFSINVLDRYFL